MSAATAGLRPIGWRHPEWWTAAAAVGGWLVLFAAAGAHQAGADSARNDHALGLGRDHGWAAGLGWWALMVVAMMVPLSLTTVRHVAMSSPWRRRHRAAAGFLAAFVGVWVAAGAVVVAATGAALTGLGPAVTVVAAFVLAAVWQVTPAKQRWLRRCQRTVPLAPHGWRADRDCARFGAMSGWSCVMSCWALMAATVAAAHSVVVMAALFGVQVSERVQRRPDFRMSAVLVAGLGAVVVAARALHHG